jgi:predicted dehydrogenase
VDGGPDETTNGYRRVPVGPSHPYFTRGMAMDFPGCNYSQNDLFVFQARAFLEQVAGLDRLPPCPSFAHGLRSLRVIRAVVESAQTRQEVTID